MESPVCDAASGSPDCPSEAPGREPPAAAGPESAEAAAADELRLRFLSFNMANSGYFSNVSTLQGPGGRGTFEDTFTRPLPDGGAVDLAFVTLVETRLALTDWLQQHLARRQGPLDVAVSQNAVREGNKDAGGWPLQGMLEGVAANWNGNLKSVLAFASRKFEEEESLVLHGRLTETTLAGVRIPNPKKAFIGRTVVASGADVRLCMVGAHFPINKIAEALEERESAPGIGKPLHACKISLARVLRKVLRKASRQRILDGETLLVLQGDLNSRTVLEAEGASDVLQEILRDSGLQAAIQHDLGLPPGRWHEVPAYGSAADLPVTYKFQERPGHVFDVPDGDPAGSDIPSFTIGDVLRAASASFPPAAEEQGPDLYRRVLQDVPSQQLQGWGIQFKEGEKFMPFRFPAAADRILYWAPNGLAARLTWVVHRGGYQIHHTERGSDHRPVTLEVTLRIAKDKGPGSTAEAQAEAELAEQVCQSDSEGSEADEVPGAPTTFWGRKSIFAARKSLFAARR